MKFKITVAIVLLTVLTACTKYYYTPALYQNDVQYMAKPYSKDSVKHAFYASGQLLVQGNGSDDMTSSSGLLNVYYSQTFKYINMSYGLLGFAGLAENSSQNDNLYKFNKNFIGFGSNASVSGYIPFKNADWRVLGIDAVFTKEFGEYADYRKSGITTDRYIFIPQTRLFTYGLFSEVIIKPSDVVSLAFKIGINHTGGQVSKAIYKTYFNNGEFNAVVGYKRLQFIAGMRYRPTEYIADPIGIQLGAAYRF